MEIKLKDCEVKIDDNYILGNDIIFPGEYNPHNIRLWVIGHEYGAICAVWAGNEQDAFDEMVDAGLGDAFLVESDDMEDNAEYAYLGNASEAADLDNAWIEEVDLKKQHLALIIRLAECRGGNYDTLDF